MRAPAPLHIAIILFIIGAALLVLIATHKTKATTVASESALPAAEDTFSKYVEEAEQQNALERDQREAAAKLAKLIKARKESVECQFWSQQKQKQSSDKRIQEKITQFCELPPTGNASATSADSQGSAK